MPLDCQQPLTLLASNAARDRYDLRSHNVPKLGVAGRMEKIESRNRWVGLPDIGRTRTPLQDLPARVASILCHSCQL
jgi:hypothetical protein